MSNFAYMETFMLKLALTRNDLSYDIYWIFSPCIN